MPHCSNKGCSSPCRARPLALALAWLAVAAGEGSGGRELQQPFADFGVIVTRFMGILCRRVTRKRAQAFKGSRRALVTVAAAESEAPAPAAPAPARRPRNEGKPLTAFEANEIVEGRVVSLWVGPACWGNLWALCCSHLPTPTFGAAADERPELRSVCGHRC